jgi:hypothetical protein
MKTQNQIRIVYLEPLCDPEVVLVENKLETFQKLVGGYLEVIRVPHRDVTYDVVGDEEGRLKWDFSEPDVTKQTIRPNRYIAGIDILGPVFVTRSDEDGDWIGLTEEEAAEIAAILKLCPEVKPEDVKEPRMELISFEDADEMFGRAP